MHTLQSNISEKSFNTLSLINKLFSEYCVILNKKNVGINIKINKNLNYIDVEEHLNIVSNFTSFIKKYIKDKVKIKHEELINENASNVNLLIKQYEDTLFRGWFIPIYYYASGGISKKIDFIFEESSTKDKIVDSKKIEMKKTIYNVVQVRNLKFVTSMLEKYNEFMIVSNSINVLESICKILDDKKITYGVVNSEANVNQRQDVIDNFNNNKFKILVASVKCIAFGYSIYATNTIVLNEPIFEYEVYQQLINRVMRYDSKYDSINIEIGLSGGMQKTIYKSIENNVSSIEMFREAFLETEID